MTSSEVMRQLVDLALPKPCEFGEENFAGDLFVQDFCNALRERHKLDLRVYVAWACPPNVMVVRSTVGNALIRSERLDTLLIEYHKLQRAHNTWSDGLARDVASALILRWMCELLIGFRMPELAIFAHTLRPDISGIQELTNPFRDETLASISELERTALQCFCLGHEVGHLTLDKRRDVTLETAVDGLSLARHIEYSDRQAGLPEEVLVALRTIWEERLDAADLLNEVEADLFAFSSVVDFICRTLPYSLEEVIRATLQAFEAQLFLYACKHTCRLLKRAVSEQLSQREFAERDYLDGVETVVRARATVRRAGLLWAVAEHPNPPPGGRDYNAYVERVDSLLTPTQDFTALVSAILTQHARTLFAALNEKAEAARNGWFDSLLTRVEKDSNLRLDLFYILVAFGCPGGVDVVAYLRGMRSAAQHPHAPDRLQRASPASVGR